mmetsp:Transcript_45253/g.104972  ORF Transcript_45253/g.104972 Transcript_45253/m.104972 type:complete len:414 (+) Transcript_45253:347-1588(+)
MQAAHWHANLHDVMHPLWERCSRNRSSSISVTATTAWSNHPSRASGHHSIAANRLLKTADVLDGVHHLPKPLASFCYWNGLPEMACEASRKIINERVFPAWGCAAKLHMKEPSNLLRSLGTGVRLLRNGQGYLHLLHRCRAARGSIGRNAAFGWYTCFSCVSGAWRWAAWTWGLCTCAVDVRLGLLWLSVVQAFSGVRHLWGRSCLVTIHCFSCPWLRCCFHSFVFLRSANWILRRLRWGSRWRWWHARGQLLGVWRRWQSGLDRGRVVKRIRRQPTFFLMKELLTIQPTNFFTISTFMKHLDFCSALECQIPICCDFDLPSRHHNPTRADGEASENLHLPALELVTFKHSSEAHSSAHNQVVLLAELESCDVHVIGHALCLESWACKKAILLRHELDATVEDAKILRCHVST